MLYQLRNSCHWADFPPYSSVYWHYKQWRASGIIDKLMSRLHESLREHSKKSKWTSLIMVDSQAVKNTCLASRQSKGFLQKPPMGLAVDSFPLFTYCTQANISDDVGLIEMFKQNLDYFRGKPLDMPKTTILLDNGYHPERIRKE